MRALKRFTEDWKERRYRFRQVAGAVFAAALVLLARPTAWGFLLGAALMLLGMGMRMWAAGYLKKSRRLAVGGPYAFVRHPQYLGNCLIASGICIGSGHPWALALWAGLFYLFYLPAIRREDEKMARRFGEDWQQWAARTPAVIPWRLPEGGAGLEPGRWSLGRAVRNGEPLWQLLVLGALAWVGLLALEELAALPGG